jgi:hypothetical protein
MDDFDTAVDEGDDLFANELDEAIEGAPDVDGGSDLHAALSKVFDEEEGIEPEVKEEKTDEVEQVAEDSANELPSNVQEYIGQLEVEQSISHQFKETLAPHFDFLQTAGLNPYAHIGDLLQVSRTLATGSPVEKADMLATLFTTFGVDVDQLDDALYRVINKPKPNEIESTILQKLERLERGQAQIQTPQVAQTPPVNTREIEVEIQQFAAKNEFFKEVQDDMAMFLHAGKAKNLDEAYKMAVKINNEVQATIRQRAAKTTTSAKAGATSLKGSGSVAGGSTKKKSSLRELLESTWDSES